VIEVPQSGIFDREGDDDGFAVEFGLYRFGCGLNSVRIERFEGHAAEVVAFRDEVDFGLGFGPFGRYGPRVDQDSRRAQIQRRYGGGVGDDEVYLPAGAAVGAVNEEADSPETFSLTDAQHDTLRQGIDDGAYAAAYSVSTLGSLRRLNSLLAKLTDLVETNDIAGFVDIYQQVCDLYSGISDKLPDSMKELYEMLVRITELENMKDLVICLNKLSTATRGFGLYTITSENGKLTLDTLTRDGFGDPFNHGLRAFAANDEQGWMVIGTANPFMGTQLWRTTVDMTDPMDRFTDLDPNGWAYPSIEYCVRHGLMSGMSDTIFSPNTVTTRAQLVQVLYNFEGKPDVSDVAVPFTDAARGRGSWPGARAWQVSMQTPTRDLSSTRSIR